MSSPDSLEQRLLAARNIAQQVEHLAGQAGLSVMKLAWNEGRGIEHTGPHHLELSINGRDAQLDISDQELLQYARDPSDAPLDARLRDFVAQFQQDRIAGGAARSGHDGGLQPWQRP